VHLTATPLHMQVKQYPLLYVVYQGDNATQKAGQLAATLRVQRRGSPLIFLGVCGVCGVAGRTRCSNGRAT